MNYKNIFAMIGSAVISFLAVFDRFLPVIICVITFAALDFATGLVKGKIKKEISSQRAFIGFWKKTALLAALFLGILLDFSLPSLVSGSEYAALCNGISFSTFIGFYIVICEAISIVENLYECSVPLPKFIISFLKVCKNKIDNREE